MTSEKRVYFHGLNGLRFFAALAVIITHVELIKNAFGYKNAWQEPLIFNLGGLGVYFFFVLSGFLITYLLLVEKERFGKVAIKAFYVRRILRIWPLYYLIVILGFFVLPHFQQIRIPYLQLAFDAHFGTNLLLYLLILPNLAFSMFPAVPHIGQLWSIGVEEQFYILWPVLISRVRSVPKALYLVIGILVLIKAGVLLLGLQYQNESWYQTLKLFLAMSKFECMAIGGLGAYYLFTQHQLFLKIVYNRVVMWTSVVLMPLIIYFAPAFLQDGIHLVFSVLFLIVIMNVSAKTTIMQVPFLSYLGKISYGLYMYHLMIIPMVLLLVSRFDLDSNTLLWKALVYSLVLLCTFTISATSFELLEKRFIKLKNKFALIQSGDENAEIKRVSAEGPDSRPAQ